MGCTSSAPSTIPLNSNTADKSMQFEEETNKNQLTEVDVADIDDENRNNETKVLPSCDINEEPVQLIKNNKSTTSLASEKGVSANGHVHGNRSPIETLENTQNEVKIPKLELLMDKVFETNQHLNESDNKVNESNNITPNPSDEVESTDKLIEESNIAVVTETSENPRAENENNVEEAEETKEASPSQSESSRATRWEALADIAAELPPSLAVDPVTGQIYQIALTK